MVVIFECHSLVARAMSLLFGNSGESSVFPSIQIPTRRAALEFLIEHAENISSIFISSYASFKDPSQISDYEGIEILEEILILEELDDIPKVLYGFDPIERLAAQGKELPFDDYEGLFQFVKLPGRFEVRSCLM
jgi:hypothetical protein